VPKANTFGNLTLPNGNCLHWPKLSHQSAMDGVRLRRRDRYARFLVHTAAGNLTLLSIVGVEAAPDLYGKLEGEVVPRMMAMIAKNDSLEKCETDKPRVISLLRRSLLAVRTALTQASDAALERQDVFFGERTTVRRVYMRGLTHMHEHMGQLIAYTRAMGMSARWPDWRESGRKIIERGQAALRK
jgi:hypothetical protein